MGDSKTSPLLMPSSLFLLFLTLSWTCPITHLAMAQQQQQPIKTIVVLVMENRSFDHLLGWMKKAINPAINGVTDQECNPVSTQNPAPKSICFTDDAEFVDPDPAQYSAKQLAAVLNGDHFLSSFPDGMSKKMSVKEAHEYAKGDVSRFIRASKEAIKLGADESAIVDMRCSLTTRSSI